MAVVLKQRQPARQRVRQDSSKRVAVVFIVVFTVVYTIGVDPQVELPLIVTAFEANGNGTTEDKIVLLVL